MNQIVPAGHPVPALAGTDDHELNRATAGWLLSVASEHTREAYQADLGRLLVFLADHGVPPRRTERGHIDAWIRQMEATPTRYGRPPAVSTVGRRVSAAASWFDYLVDAGLVAKNPVHKRSRPRVSNDSTTVALDTVEGKQFSAAALARTADGYVEDARVRAVLMILLTLGIRVGELADLTVASLGFSRGHITLRVTGKGRKTRILAVPPPAIRAISSHLADRARAAGCAREDLPADLPLIERGASGLLTDKAVARMIQRVARRAGIESWRDLSAHSLRHTNITAALEAGAALTAVQDSAGHADPRTTRRYDHARQKLDNSPAYAVAHALVDDDEDDPAEPAA